LAKFFTRFSPFVAAAMTCFVLALFPLIVYLSPVQNTSDYKFLAYIALGINALGMCGIHLLWNLVAIYFADRKQNDSAPYMSAHLLMVAIRGMTLPIIGVAILEIEGFETKNIFLFSAVVFLIASILFLQYQYSTHLKRRKNK